jgi:Na+-transporting NADH:ubiquinone oxidoreductase subunit NqrF
MVKAVLAMLDDLGVEAESIHFDDFGGASSAVERT